MNIFYKYIHAIHNKENIFLKNLSRGEMGESLLIPFCKISEKLLYERNKEKMKISRTLGK